MNTVIVPVIKNKSGDVSDTNNYRPIALSSIVSKVFEIILLSRCDEYIGSSDCSSVLNPDIQPIFVYTHSKKLYIFIIRTHLLYLFVIWTPQRHFIK